MPVESAADRAALFDVTEFGEAAIWNSTVVNGLFENEFAAVADAAGVAVESSRPVFTCRSTDITAITHGDAITINSIGYTIAGIEPDDAGLTKLILEEA